MSDFSNFLPPSLTKYFCSGPSCLVMHSPFSISFYLKNLDFCSGIHLSPTKLSISGEAKSTFSSARWRPNFSPQVSDYFRNHWVSYLCQWNTRRTLLETSGEFFSTLSGELPEPNCFFSQLWMREYVVLISTTSYSIPKETEAGQIQTGCQRKRRQRKLVSWWSYWASGSTTTPAVLPLEFQLCGLINYLIV